MIKIRFLFGSKASRKYYNEPFENLLQAIKTGCLRYGLFIFESSKHTPEEIIKAYEPWDGYAIISEEELKQIQNERRNNRHIVCQH